MASTYLSRTPASAGNRKTFTISVWVKRTKIGVETAICSAWDANNISSHFVLRFSSTDVINIGRWSIDDVTTTRLFRDTNAWYHIVLAVDTTQATAADRMKLYVNGVQETSFSVTTYPNQNDDLKFNSNVAHNIGRNLFSSPTGLFEGCMSHFHFIDGTAYLPTVFGETDATTGEWKIKTDVTATYGTNGFFILKDGNSVTDQSGNSNNFTVAAGTLTNTEDNPSNVFATWNNLNRATAAGIQANGIQNGNTYIATVAQNQYQSFASTLAFSGTGKFYMEFKVGNIGTDYAVGIGEAETMSSSLSSASPFKFSNNAKGWAYTKNGNKETGGSGSSYGDSFTNYDYIGLAYNNGALWFSKNGTWQNSATISEINAGTTTNAAFTGIDTSKQYFIMFAGYNDAMIEMNAGNGYFRTTVIGSPNNPTSGDTNAKFKYTVPTGYQPLSTKGLNE